MDAFAWPAFTLVDPTFIKLYREPKGILSSIHRTPFMRNRKFTDEEWLKLIDAHHEELKQLPGYWVDTDALVAGDASSLEAAMEGAGLVYNPAIAKAMVR